MQAIKHVNTGARQARQARDRTIMQNPQNIAKEFNKSFTSVGSKLVKKIPNTEKRFQVFLTFHNEKMQFEEINFDEF